MKIKELADLYNHYLPSIEQMKERSIRFTSIVDDFEIRERQRYLKFNYEIEMESEIAEKKLHQLVEQTNISNLDPGNIVFYNKLEASDHVVNGLEFACQNDYDRICLDISNSTIVWYNNDSDDVEIIARNLDQFLLFLIECHKYKMSELYNVEYSEEQSRAQIKNLIADGLSKAIVRDHIRINDFLL